MNFLKKTVILLLFISLAGCGFIYNKETLKKFDDPKASYNCNYEVLLNVHNDKKDANYIESQHFQTIGTTTVTEFWFWPWPPEIPYYRDDFKALVCKTGADAIEIFRGVGAPHFRNAEIRLLKRNR